MSVDYRDPGRALHAPIKHTSGRVDPEPSDDGRARNFGPQSKADTPKTSDNLSIALQTFRAAEPRMAGRFLALAKRRGATKPNQATAINPEVEGDPEAIPADASPRSLDASHDNENGGYRLNFEDADIKDVLQAVLGKILGLTYTIAPNVTGRITIAATAPQSREDVLSTLETVLSLQGLSLTKVGATYRIAPLSLGGGAIDTQARAPGFGISIVLLKYTSVASMAKLLSGFLVDADGIRIASSLNAMVVRGPGPRREEIVRAITAFDADWMHQQAVSVFELKRSRPEDVIQELTRIFDIDNSNGDTSGVIQFKAIRRLRAIMVISKNPMLVRRAGVWIRRLDHKESGASDAVFVYRPRYRDAKDLTRMVNSLFGQGDNNADNAPQTSGSGLNGPKPSGSDPSAQRPIGISSAPFAGGLSSGGLGTPGGGQTAGSAGGPQNGSLGGTGSGGLTAGGAGGGLQGTLADPVEASQNGGSGRGRLKLSADVSNNTIVAYTDGETYSKVLALLRQLDIAPLQVAVNVIIAEVQLNDELKYGIQFFLNSRNNRGSLGLNDTATQILASKLPGFNFLVGGASSPDVVISALDSISKVHILSSPSIVVMENRPATLEVGNQVPVVTQQAQSTLTAGAPTLNSVTYLDTGIILKIIPRIGQNGFVAMDLDQEISSVVPDNTGSTTSLTPTISKRRIASAISVKSGQSVLLAGLITDTRQQQKGQVPFVGDLGDILGHKDNSFARTELVVFIRPVIVRDGKDAEEVADDFKHHLKAMDVHKPPVYKP
jgi:general secretion pathway protein D